MHENMEVNKGAISSRRIKTTQRSHKNFEK